MAGVGFTKNLRQGNVGPTKLRAAGTEFGLRLHGRSESDRIQIEEEFTDWFFVVDETTEGAPKWTKFLWAKRRLMAFASGREIHANP